MTTPPPVTLPTASPRGFTAIPRAVFDRLLCMDLTKRELAIVLLIMRLTYGCRNSSWAILRQADLAAVGIKANHAKACLEALLNKGVIAYDQACQAYQVVPNFARNTGNPSPEEGERTKHLSALVARHLTVTADASKHPIPKQGSPKFPFWEEIPSQNGNRSPRSLWQFSRSRQGFVRISELAKDRERQI